jgi:hypothetical protein
MTLPSSGIASLRASGVLNRLSPPLVLLAEIRSYLERYLLRDYINLLTLPYQSALAFLVLKADNRFLGRDVPR